MGAFAAVAQGTDEEPRADHAALRAGGRERPAARARRQGGHLRHRRHLDQARRRRCSEMKFDMSGGAAVLRGDRRRSPGSGCRCALVGVVGATENMPSGHAMKPGDIVRARERHDDRDQQHRRRGPPRARRLPDPRGRAGRRAARRPRDADRRDRHRARLDLRGPDGQRRRVGGARSRRAGERTRRAASGGCRCTPSTRS